VSFAWNPAAIDELANSPAMANMLDGVGRKLAAEARRNARTIFPEHGPGKPVGKKKTAIERGVIRKPGRDNEGHYIDVGFHTGHAGFVLFWAEVGTETQPPRPLLRSALDKTRI